MNKAIITQVNHMDFLWIYENDVIVECHPLLGQQTVCIGDIYIGRVEKVVKNIQSAFIRLDKENVGYLPLNDKPYRVLNRSLPKGLPSIAENDLVLVQIEQEPQKMKQARVTGNISLSGNYVAIDLDENRVGVSKKIKDVNRNNELKDLLLKQSNREYGFVLRTACENIDNEIILKEYEDLCSQLRDFIKTATYERKTGCIYHGKEAYLSILEDYGIHRLDEIIVDRKEIYEYLINNHFDKTRFYEEDYPLCKLYSLETELSHIVSKKVWLKSGGFLVIEPTEAMVVIDVNTGKSIGKKDKDKHILKINLEAAKEAARQIRLRNLSGIIMVDFINMTSAEDKKLVAEVIEKELHRDKVPGYLVEITKLDLFEITRKKIRKPIYEVVTNFNL